MLCCTCERVCVGLCVFVCVCVLFASVSFKPTSIRDPPSFPLTSRSRELLRHRAGTTKPSKRLPSAPHQVVITGSEGGFRSLNSDPFSKPSDLPKDLADSFQENPLENTTRTWLPETLNCLSSLNSLSRPNSLKSLNSLNSLKSLKSLNSPKSLKSLKSPPKTLCLSERPWRASLGT